MTPSHTVPRLGTLFSKTVVQHYLKVLLFRGYPAGEAHPCHMYTCMHDWSILEPVRVVKELAAPWTVLSQLWACFSRSSRKYMHIKA